MKLHEFQAKNIFKDNGIAVPRSVRVQKALDAPKAYETLGSRTVMVKAQVLAGGRGKAGGILKCETSSEVLEAASKLIGSQLKTIQTGSEPEIVQSVLIEEMLPIDKELYIGIAVNRSESVPNLIFSESGGMDIEEVARKEPGKVLRIPFDCQLNPTPRILKDLLYQKGVARQLLEPLSELASKLVSIFLEKDCSLIEINPLAQCGQKLIALDGKILFDDNARFRQADNEKLLNPEEDDVKEKRAKKAGLSYVSLNGNVGCLVNGAGLAMATMDMIKQAGGEPANFLDVGGGANKEQVLEAFRIILDDKNVKAVLVNIFGGIMKCDIIAQALLDAMNEMEITIPVVVRLEGTRVEEGRSLLAKSKIKLHTANAIDEAAEKAVSLAKD